MNLRKIKFYIEWDETEIRMLLPDTKRLEKVKFSEIQSVIVRLFEIELRGGEKKKKGERNILI
ncbi:MAG: hypothetical protein IPH69_18145 [Bacteroidales bacterium]|nr:hypothetical protein [Bacteroidales bacterium]